MVDEKQQIETLSHKVIWLAIEGFNLLINAPRMPVTAMGVVRDTKDKYKSVSASYGIAWSHILNDGRNVQFGDNILSSYSRIDERNLIFCVCLNIAHSSVTFLDTIYLRNLRVLIVFETKLSSLNTLSLINLEYLDI